MGYPLPNEMKKVFIIGAGPSGLAAASLLAGKFNVTILEKANFLGGLAGSFEQDGEWIPFYYHHVVSHNNYTRKYLDRFALLEGCNWKKVNVAIGVNNKLYNINNPIGLLKFNYLSLYEKFRFGLFGFYALFLMSPGNIPENLGAREWLLDYAGKGVTDKVFYNLYARNKFNISLDRISAKQFAHRLKEREVYDSFTFPKNGLQPMIDCLESSLKENGVNIIRKAPVSNIDFSSRKISFNGETKDFNIIINTIPAPEFLKVAKGIPEDYSRQIEKVKYCPCVGITFATKDLLDKDNYWINLFQEDIHVIMQHSWLIDKYKNKVSWCLRYGGSGEDFKLSDGEIKGKYLAVINKYFPNTEIIWSKVFREKYAEPIYDKEFSDYKPDYITPVRGLYMSGVQVTHPKIRNINSALLSGEEVARIITEREL